MVCYLDFLWGTYGTLIIIIGLIGNILSIFVLRRPAMEYIGIRKHLMLLSFSDFIACATGTVVMWSNYVLEVDIRGLDLYACKILVYLNRTSMMYSSWILLVISIDRLNHVFYPMKIARANRLGLKLGLSFFLIVVSQLYSLYFYEVIYQPDEVGFDNGRCQLSHHDNKHVSVKLLRITSVIFTSLYSVIPCVILTICNIAIIYKLRVPTQLDSGHNAVNGRKMVNIRLIISLSIVFIVTTGPLGGIIIGTMFYRVSWGCLWGYLSLLAFTNNSMNFLLYVFSGQNFRRELVKLLKINRLPLYKDKWKNGELSIIESF